MFDEITPTYDLLNSLLSVGNDRRWRSQAIERLAPSSGQRILDLGCGTAELLLEVADRVDGVDLTGVDVAPRMLRRARQKGLAQEVPLDLIRADALRLPFPDDRFDGAISAFTLRNVPDVEGFFEEVRRVLRPGGRIVTLEIHLPEEGAFAALYRPYFLHVLPRIGDLLSGRTGAYRYLSKSVASFHRPGEVGEIARQAGFSDVDVQPLTFGTAALVTGRNAR